jgi:asparagine synthase (glutamine-hydrolysing)
VCGVGGWLGDLPCKVDFAENLAQRLRHRGPNGYGIKSWSEATLVHTRLSIIDLSPTGAQPMANEDGTIWTVFNGEVYNHRELRRDLESCGHKFKGRSDTEVLPHLYEEAGLSFVEKLRGMFALAIYDRRNRMLILARDRFGIKPLFYSQQNNRLAFASEIKALLEFPGINKQPDKQAIYDFATLFYIPAPETFYKGIRALQPGEILVAQLEHDQVHCKIQTFHHWTIAPDSRLTLSQAAKRAEELVTGAVHRQMESDVPLGALLSGGIDSSLVSVAAQEVSNGRIRTFNVRFPDKAYDETWAAVSVAKYIGSCHETLDLHEAQGSWNYVTELLAHAGQPFADTSLFAANAVCRLIRQHVTVALSGDGGDEGFGGYGHYWEIARIAHLQRIPVPLWYAATTLMAPLANLGIVPDRVPLQLMEFVGADDTTIVQNLFSFLRNDEHSAIFIDRDVLPVRRFFERQWEHQLPPGTSRLDRLSAHATEVNVRLTLANDFLFKVDTASMQEGLEVRVPMLDEDLFEFALSLPHFLKVKDRTGKRVLREVARRKLPLSVAQKPKMGFAVPVDTWLDADFRERLKDVLLGPSSKLPEFFRPEAYRPLIESFCNGRPDPRFSRRDSYRRAMMLLSVQLALANPL